MRAVVVIIFVMFCFFRYLLYSEFYLLFLLLCILLELSVERFFFITSMSNYFIVIICSRTCSVPYGTLDGNLIKI